MQMHEAVELLEAFNLDSANEAIQEGWRLLAVVPGASGVTYVLGKARPRAHGLLSSPRNDSPRG